MVNQLSIMRNKLNLGDLETLQLLQAHAAIIEELRNRKVLRTSNNPVGDYAEWLVTQKLGLKLERNSSSGFDATDNDGLRIQIKSRRVTEKNKSVQMSSIRNLLDKPFDELVGVIFKEDFEVDYAARIPYAIIVEHSAYKKHTNSHIFHFRRSILELPEVIDLSNHF